MKNLSNSYDQEIERRAHPENFEKDFEEDEQDQDEDDEELE